MALGIDELSKRLTDLVRKWAAYAKSPIKNASVRIQQVRDQSIIYTSTNKQIEFSDGSEGNEISIFVPQDYDILPILHEIGHYFGCRKRETIRPSYICKMVVFWMLRDIYYHAYNDAKCYKREEEGIISKIERDRIYDLVKPLVESQEKNVIEEIIGRTNKSIVELQRNDNDGDVFIDTQIFTFVACEETIQVLWDESSKGLYYQYLDDDVIKNAMKEMAEVFSTENEGFLRIKHCVPEICDLFSEPTADIFMFNILGIDFDEYIDAIFEAHYKKQSADSFCRGKALFLELRDAFMNQDLLIRLLAVYCCVCRHDGVLERYDPTTKTIDKIRGYFDVKCRFKTSMKLMFGEMVDRAIKYFDCFIDENNSQKKFSNSIDRMIQAVLNPFDIVYEYISIINRDKRYLNLSQTPDGEENEVLQNLLCSIREIREIYSSEKQCKKD